MARPAERVRDFRVNGQARAAVSVGGAEHFTLPPRPIRGLREVNVYLGWFAAAGPRRAGRDRALGAAVTRVPGVRRALRLAGERAGLG